MFYSLSISLCCKLSLDARILKKLILINFCQFFKDTLGSTDVWSSLLCHFADIRSLSFKQLVFKLSILMTEDSSIYQNPIFGNHLENVTYFSDSQH